MTQAKSMFSTYELEQIDAATMTLEEQLARSGGLAAILRDYALVSTWRRVAAADDAQRFDAMVRHRLAGQSTSDPDVELRSDHGSRIDWLREFVFVADILGVQEGDEREGAQSLREGASRFLSPVSTAVWEELVNEYPVQHLLNEDAAADARAALVNRLIEVVLPALQTARAETKGRKKRWIVSASEFRSLVLRFPVLARVVGTTVSGYRSAMRKFLFRLVEDIQLVRDHAGSPDERDGVTCLDMDRSDRHDGGQSVIIVTLESGGRIVYKPRSVAVDVAWADFLVDLDKAGAPASVYVPRTVSRSGYGWVEHVASRSCGSFADVDEYYRRAGALLCLLYFTQTTDAHEDNLLAAGSIPVLLDAETTMHPWLQTAHKAEGRFDEHALSQRESVLSTGLLPELVVSGAHDMSPAGALSYAELDEDATRHDLHHALPRLDGKFQPALNHGGAIEAGFRQMYEFVLGHKAWVGSADGPLRHFADVQTRVVFKNTMLYDRVLQLARAPSSLVNGIEWSMSFEYVARIVHWDAATDAHASILREEIRALCEGDFPYFTSAPRSLTVTTASGNEVAGVIERPPFDQVLARIANADRAGMASEIEFLRSALAGSRQE